MRNLSNTTSSIFSSTASNATAEPTSQVAASPEVNAGRPQRQPDQRFSALGTRRSTSPPVSRCTTPLPSDQNTSLVTRQKTEQELFTEWDVWAQAGEPSEESRTQAVRLMKQWINNNNPEGPLRLSYLGLSSLPENLPVNVRCLNVRNNRLSSLPENLPVNLHTLDVRNNQLSSLPENLSVNLHTLDAGYNLLSRLPENLSANMRVLNAIYNPLSSLPENILTLPNTCIIFIDADHLSEAVRNRLTAAMNAPGYDNVHIDYNMGSRPNVQARALQKEVSVWAQEAGNITPIDWSAFQSTPHAGQFSQFLVRLRETGDYLKVDTKSNFQQRVGNLLHQLEDDSEVRGTCFNLAHDAVDTCGDRVALRMLNMEAVCLDKRLETDIGAGKFDLNPQAVLDYCKAQYRQQTLSDVASAKIKTLNFCDEIEVTLGFLVAFSAEFKFNAQMNTMLYAACSNIAPEDVFETRKKLTNRAFTEETKALYGPFFEQQGRQALLDRWNALPVHQEHASETTENNRALQQFLANSPAMKLLVKRRYPAEASSLQKNIEQEIEKKQKSLHDQLDKLDSGNSQYRQQCQELQQQYSNVPEEVNAQMKQTLLQRFCSENDVRAHMD